MFFNLLSEAKWYPFLFSGDFTDVARSVAFWLTVAIIIAFAVNMLLTKGATRKKCAKLWLIFAIIYACAVAALFLALTFKEDGIQAILFIPLIILVASIAASAVILYLKRTRPVIIATACVMGAALVATLICMGVYFNSGAAEDNNRVQISSTENALLYVLTAVLLIVLVVVALFGGKNDNKGFDSKTIAFAGICIAMSFALSYIRIVKLPQGGSITLASLLPLLIFSYFFGVRKGIFAGFIYGLLQAIQDPWIVHPAQFLLDYPVAFACIGVAGLFANVKKLEKAPQVKFALGAVVASVLRFAAHLISGVFAFSEYAGDTNPWIYSIAYNSFVFIDVAIAIVVGVLLFSSKSFISATKRYAIKKLDD